MDRAPLPSRKNRRPNRHSRERTALLQNFWKRNSGDKSCKKTGFAAILQTILKKSFQNVDVRIDRQSVAATLPPSDTQTASQKQTSRKLDNWRMNDDNIQPDLDITEKRKSNIRYSSKHTTCRTHFGTTGIKQDARESDWCLELRPNRETRHTSRSSRGSACGIEALHFAGTSPQDWRN